MIDQMFWEDVLSRNMMFSEQNDELRATKVELTAELEEANARIDKFDQEHEDGIKREKKALEDAKALEEEVSQLK